MPMADLKLVFYKEKGGYNYCQDEDQSNSDRPSQFSRDDTYLSVAEATVVRSGIDAINFYDLSICLLSLVFNASLIF